MKNILGIVIAVTIAAAVAPFAHARVIASIDPLNQGIGWRLSELSGTRIVDLGMTPGHANDPFFFKRGNDIYLTTTAGVAKLKVGATKVTILKKGENLNIADIRNALFLVQDITATFAQNKGAFLFDATTKKTTKLTPKIGLVTQARIAPNGKWLAAIGNNTKGKPVLYTSSAGISQIVTTSLPKNTKACYDLSIAPDSSALAVVCTFTQTNTSTPSGLLLGTYKNRALTLKTKPYYDTNFSWSTIAWTDKKTLVSLGISAHPNAGSIRPNISIQGMTVHLARSPFSTALHTYTIGNSQVKKRAVLSFDTSSIITNPELLPGPTQLFRISDALVGFTISWADLASLAGSSSMTYLGSYNLSTQTQNVILNDQKINIFGDVPLIAYP